MAHDILSIIIILIVAKLFGELAERVGQASVLGELLAGVIIGGSVLGWVHGDQPLLLLAQLGVILLLFQIGLESDLGEFLKVGLSAFVVAILGVVGPFVAGYFASRALGLSVPVAIFTGATLTATSVGITARSLKDLGRLDTSEARIILGAAVIDDVIGLIILAVVGSLVAHNPVSVLGIAKTTALALIFLVGSIAIGIPLAPYVLKYACRLQSRGVLTVLAIVFSLGLALIAEKLQLATIVGAFAAGLILSRTEHTVHIQERVRPLADVFVPIFFVLLGTSVNVGAFNPFNPANRTVLLLLGVLLLISIGMKMIAGMGVLTRGVNRLAVGIGMIPRGEVGLIFASTGLAGGFISPKEYSAIMAVIVVTTFITPPLLKAVLSKET